MSISLPPQPGHPVVERDESNARAPIPLRRQIVAALIVSAISFAAILLLPPLAAAGMLVFVSILYLARRLVFTWVAGLALLVAVIMFIPVRRYAVPIPLPFELEPYRIMLLLLVTALVASLLLDRNRVWQPVAFGWPIGIFVATLVISIVANGPSLVEDGLASSAVGALINVLLLLSTFYIVRQLLSTERIVMGLLLGLVWSGVAVALMAIFERATRVNLFWRLNTILPLELLTDESESFRAGGYRAYASSQHPIALSVMFCMLIPLAIYLARYGKRPMNEISRRIVYGAAVFVLLGGVLSAVSRTAVIVLGVMLLLTILLRPNLGIALLLLAVPGLLIGLVALPKVFDTLVLSFLDIDGLIASQQTSPGWGGAGRLADLAPAMAEAQMSPFFGTGIGSRIVVGADSNAFILDNQVLGTLLETGALGVLGLAIFTLAPASMLIRFAFTTSKDDTRIALMAFAVAVSMSGYIAALFFYDAFGFYQTFFIWCLLMAIGAWLLTASPPAVAARTVSSFSQPVNA